MKDLMQRLARSVEKTEQLRGMPRSGCTCNVVLLGIPIRVPAEGCLVHRCVKVRLRRRDGTEEEVAVDDLRGQSGFERCEIDPPDPRTLFQPLPGGRFVRYLGAGAERGLPLFVEAPWR